MYVVSPNLRIEWVDDEGVVLDEASKEVHYLNPTAALVLALIQERGYEGAVRELQSRFGTDEHHQAELAELVREMANKGLLLET
jgi:hypothetical protein